MQTKTKQFSTLFPLLLLVGFILSACAGRVAQPEAPTLDLNGLSTLVAGTLQAAGSQTAESQPTNTATPEATQTPFVVTATYTETPPGPTNTPTATATNTSVPTPVSVCHRANFIADLTVPDGTLMSPNQNFTKTWRLSNSGTCAWTATYDVVYVSGTNMAASKVFDLPKKVNPGETVDISIPMQAPNKGGSYTGYWMIRSDDGKNFGVGSDASVAFFVKVGVSPQVNSSYAYDFAANYCSAEWKSDTGKLACPGSVGGSKGFVIVSSNPVLEDRNEDELGLWMRPNHASDGYIRGVYPFYTVQSGDSFVAVIGCHGDSANCRVQFTLSYITQNGVEKQLGTWDERNEGMVREVTVDLSSLVGKKVRFVLTVEPNNNNFTQADAIWFVPSIRN